MIQSTEKRCGAPKPPTHWGSDFKRISKEFDCRNERFRLTEWGGALGALMCLTDECKTTEERYEKLAHLQQLINNDINAVLARRTLSAAA